MVVVPPGEFMMGSGYGPKRAKPITRVKISDAFAIGKYEVTKEQFEKFVRETGHRFNDECWTLVRKWRWGRSKGNSFRSPGFKQGENHPAVCIVWRDAKAYTRWLSEETGRDYRLPTHAEWEYVARGGKGALRFWWGNKFRPEHANARGTPVGDKWEYTAPVGSFPANPFGVFDIIGNAREWVEDCAHLNYENAATDGRSWPGTCSFGRVSSGGSWGKEVKYLGSAYGGGHSTISAHSTAGFRVALSLKPRVPVADKHDELKKRVRRMLQYVRDNPMVFRQTRPDLTPGTLFSDCQHCPPMVVVPAGEFVMGSNISAKDRKEERPVRTVKIAKPFAVGQFEVTVLEYLYCVQDNWCARPGWLQKNSAGNVFDGSDATFVLEQPESTRKNHPITTIKWSNAKQYVRWLSEKTAESYRLLTEAEWEYVAKAGTGDKHYWWGNKPTRNHANYGKDEGLGTAASGKDRWHHTAPVGSFPANPFKIHDLHGNVFEWVEDCYDKTSYKRAPKDSRAWYGESSAKKSNCLLRSIRGGGYFWPVDHVRSSRRNGQFARWSRTWLGFRVAKTLLSQTEKSELRAKKQRKLTRLLQKELQRLNCDPGSVLGVWDDRTRASVAMLNTVTGEEVPTDRATAAALRAMMGRTVAICREETIPAIKKTKKMGVEANAREPVGRSQTALDPAQPKEEPDLARSLQAELSRVGCDPGAVDGAWGAKSRAALAAFNKYAKERLPTEEPTKQAFQTVKSATDRVCPSEAAKRDAAKKRVRKKLRDQFKTECETPGIWSTDCPTGVGR